MGAGLSESVDVVVVDDDFLVVKVHTRFVESVPGFRVVATAASGQAALDAVREHDPHLVLLDVHLPDMTGIVVGSWEWIMLRPSSRGVLCWSAPRTPRRGGRLSGLAAAEKEEVRPHAQHDTPRVGAA